MAQDMQTFKHEFKKLLTTEELESLARYELSGEPAIKKVLHVQAQPKITSSESIDGVTNFSGKTTYSVVYEAEDATLKSLMFDATWQGKTAAENCILSPRAVETTVTGVSGADINISTLLNIDVFVTGSEQIDNVINLPSDYVLSQKTFDLQRSVAAVSGAIDLAAELEVNYKVDDVCLTTASVRNVVATAQLDTICLTGEVDVNVVLTSEGRAFEETKTIAFKEEVAALLSNPSCSVDANVTVSQLKTTAAVSDIDKKSSLTMSVELGVVAAVYQTEQATLTRDAFSLSKQLNLSTEGVTCQIYQSSGEKQDSANANIELDIELDSVDFATVLGADITDVQKTETGYTLKGCVQAKLVGQAGNEHVACNCQIPFVTSVDDPCATDFVVAASQTHARLRTQKEVELTANLAISYNKYATEFIDFVSSLEELGEMEERPSAVRVHVVKGGEDLFQVAKKLGVTVDQIVVQNPNLGEELTGGERVVVYCPLSID